MDTTNAILAIFEFLLFVVAVYGAMQYIKDKPYVE